MGTIYLVIKGGLGNQLFQAALGLALAQETQSAVRYIVDGFIGYSYPHKFLLDKMPALRGLVVPLEGIKELPKFNEEGRVESDRPLAALADLVAAHGDIILDGYWQNETYFRDHRELIRSNFAIAVNDATRDFADRVRAENTIAIHVRRNDYGHHGLASMDYYRSSLAAIRKENGDLPAIIFTDEYNFCAFEFASTPNVRVVRGNPEDPLAEFYLMSRCAHFIMANSTFSWWAAWLGEIDSSIVYTPHPWCVFLPQQNPVPSRWRSIRDAVRAP